MATLLRQSPPFRNCISGIFLFGCALTAALVASPRAEAQMTTTICKQTNPSPNPWGTSFTFTGANSWASGSGKDFSVYTPTPLPTNPFQMKDGDCKTIDITTHDKFNRFTESPVPPGWSLTNIKCSFQKSAVFIVGGNPNKAFQPGDNTVRIDQTDPNVTCTFINTLACFRPSSISLPPCTQPGQQVNLDLSTRNTAGVDPNWTVTPGGPNPTHTTLPPWVALPNNWVKPTNKLGAYTYTRRFHLPCSPDSYKSLDLKGDFAADNGGKVYLNGNLLATCTGPLCFQLPAAGTPFSQTGPANFVAGMNQLTVTVDNDPGSYTGLSVTAKVSATCGSDCVCGCPPGTILKGGSCVTPPPDQNKTERVQKKR